MVKKFKALMVWGVLFLSYGSRADDYPYLVENKDGNLMQIIEYGVAALDKRIELIRRAQKTLELEYFIYDPDISGKIISTELIKKARAGVKVRLLIDKSISVIRFNEYYTRELEKYGIEIKYYRRAMDPSTAQFRNHRKLIVMDGSEAILGGRNIADDYFDLSHEYNFNDRDLWVKGPLVTPMLDSFNDFWNHPASINVPPVNIREFSRLNRGNLRRDPVRYRRHLERESKARKFFIENEELENIRNQVMEIGGIINKKNKEYHCPHAVFVSDKPGGHFANQIEFKKYKRDYRRVGDFFREKVRSVEHSLILDTPYFILNKATDEVLKKHLEDKKELLIYSNSLYSTDAVYMAASFYKEIWKLIGFGAQVFVHDGNFHHDVKPVFPEMKIARYGAHAKSMVFDDDAMMIGSYNIDPRSDFYNSEMMVYCKGNQELVNELKQNIRVKINKSFKFLDGKRAINPKGDEVSIYSDASKKQIRLMNAIKIPVSWVDFLL